MLIHSSITEEAIQQDLMFLLLLELSAFEFLSLSCRPLLLLLSPFFLCTFSSLYTCLSRSCFPSLTAGKGRKGKSILTEETKNPPRLLLHVHTSSILFAPSPHFHPSPSPGSFLLLLFAVGTGPSPKARDPGSPRPAQSNGSFRLCPRVAPRRP